MALRVLLDDDHKLVLEAGRHAREKDDGFTVVATADSGAKVADLVARHRPDIVPKDLRLRDGDGRQALDQTRPRDKSVKAVMLSASNSPAEIQSALSRGANGFILKS